MEKGDHTFQRSDNPLSPGTPHLPPHILRQELHCTPHLGPHLHLPAGVLSVMLWLCPCCLLGPVVVVGCEVSWSVCASFGGLGTFIISVMFHQGTFRARNRGGQASALFFVIRAGGCPPNVQALNFQVLGHWFSLLALGGSVLKLFEIIIIIKTMPLC